MPIKLKHKKDILICSYELDALFLTHLYELLFAWSLFDWAPH